MEYGLLPKDLYENSYLPEMNKARESLKESCDLAIREEKWKDYPSSMSGLSMESLSKWETLTQGELAFCTFDSKYGCHMMNIEDLNLIRNGTKINTMADGGTVPLMMSEALMDIGYSYKDADPIVIGNLLCENGHRTENNGTRWPGIEIIPQNHYGCETRFITSFEDLMDVLELVDQGVASIFSLTPVKLVGIDNTNTSAAITIKGYEAREAGLFWLKSSHHPKILKVSAKELLSNLTLAILFKRK